MTQPASSPSHITRIVLAHKEIAALEALQANEGDQTAWAARSLEIEQARAAATELTLAAIQAGVDVDDIQWAIALHADTPQGRIGRGIAELLLKEWVLATAGTDN
jgi:hypothetical protein